MIIDCEISPKILIEEIGDPFFSICDNSWDEIYRHPNHPYSLRIRDCEDNQYIDVRGNSIEDTMKISIALCKLLNQDYKKLYKKNDN